MSAPPVWRPLLMGEYPPPGPTKYGAQREDGTYPILVFAPVRASRCSLPGAQTEEA